MSAGYVVQRDRATTQFTLFSAAYRDATHHAATHRAAMHRTRLPATAQMLRRYAGAKAIFAFTRHLQPVTHRSLRARVTEGAVSVVGSEARRRHSG